MQFFFFINSDIVRILCLSFIILHCHQHKLSKRERCKWPCKLFIVSSQNNNIMTNTNPTRTPEINTGTVRRVSRYIWSSLMKKDQKKSCISSLDGSSFLFYVKAFDWNYAIIIGSHIYRETKVWHSGFNNVTNYSLKMVHSVTS